jgi:hypothetical protein
MSDSCQATKANQERCSRIICDGAKFCWQHAHGWKQRYRALTRNQSFLFWLAVAGVAFTLIFGFVSLFREFSPTPQPQDLSGIQKSLDAINSNLSRMGRPTVSAAQMAVIKELDRLLLGRDESSLRRAFGFPVMMEKNIQMNIAILDHFKNAESQPLDLRPYFIGTDWMLNSELAEGHVRRYGGGFQYDPPDGKRVYLLVLPNEYTVGRKVLLNFENSSELPTPITKAIKDFDDAVYQNADKLMHTLNDSVKKDPDLYVRYSDQSSPFYFHRLDALWLDSFIQLRPKADKIRDAVRQFLGVE